MARVLVPLAARDFDPTEVAVPWSALKDAGHEVGFATPDGSPGRADEMMLTGVGLDPWGWVPGLRQLPAVGCVLRADARGRDAYASLEVAPAFATPRRYADLRAGDWDALVLPGGHRARGMRAYLEDPTLKALVAEMFDADKPVGAICHGTVLATRALSARTGRSVLHGRKTTSLTWRQERLATRVARVSRFWDPGYYRTYTELPGEPEGYRGVQAEVTRALADPSDYRDVPDDEPDRALKNDGRHRDAPDDARPAFVVRDGSYVSARWPGDAHTFARAMVEALARG